MSKIHEISKHGQSIWYDNIRRAIITSGELEKLIESGVTGVTSNPTIFEKAIVGSSDYDADLRRLTKLGYDPKKTYENLVVEDIQKAADILRPIYDDTSARDGYISLEVDPTLAEDRLGTLKEARRLFDLVGRPNLMIKVPATPQGISALESLIADGINVNATLIFSVQQYEAVAEAYIAGLEKRMEAGLDVRNISSVASFFVSRIDSMVDTVLSASGFPELSGRTAIANAKMAYAMFTEIFRGERWESLSSLGAMVQRPLWASTGTKNRAYPDTLYVDSLIGKDTVNTVPPATLEAYLDHGRTDESLTSAVDEAKQHLDRLAEAGVNLDAITDKLLEDGLTAFANSLKTLLAGIAEKQAQLKTSEPQLDAKLGGYQQIVNEALQEMKRDRIVERIWSHDHTVWKPEPTEIVNRLGWLDIANRMQESLPKLTELTDTLRKSGYKQAVLLGMGGSSLAPEVFRKTFGVKDGYLELSILDSTDPAAIEALSAQLDYPHTVFIVSTKSGTTPETLSFFKFFYTKLVSHVGNGKAGEHFIAITDPGSQLEELAARHSFREVFLNDPDIGGRYSALSYFGLVPAALIGADLNALLDRAIRVARNSAPEDDNLGGLLGVIMGELAKVGRDKITFILSPQIASFGDWVEQLIAESTGKDGKGILPVVGEPISEPAVYRNDRLFIQMRINGDTTLTETVNALIQAGHPVVSLGLEDAYDIAQQFFLWEMATAVAGYRLGINPFDQPNVESAKILTRRKLHDYEEKGTLPEPTPAFSIDELSFYGDVFSDAGQNPMDTFLKTAEPGAYVSIQAYLPATPEINQLLNALRVAIRKRTSLATTLGYGPRFLHSTGQLHKGDAGKGLFIQLTNTIDSDVIIPDIAGKESGKIHFGTLKTAQVLGDFDALKNAGRKVIRIDLGMKSYPVCLD
ncbi:MAG: bifunctional transaldolase/phosoglucose isomerase [Anaerolineaceae bacterium]